MTGGVIKLSVQKTSLCLNLFSVYRLSLAYTTTTTTNKKTVFVIPIIGQRGFFIFRIMHAIDSNTETFLHNMPFSACYKNESSNGNNKKKDELLVSSCADGRCSL